jgi:regulator of protease activity HflC (stomatin/prohibitin superfamily)
MYYVDHRLLFFNIKLNANNGAFLINLIRPQSYWSGQGVVFYDKDDILDKMNFLTSRAFEDVNKAIQDMNRFINEGKEAYNSQIPKTQGEADKQIQIAQGYAAERVNKAKGDVARFNSVYEEYKRAPKVTKDRIYLETMEEIFSSEQKPVLIDGKLENILPLKNLSENKSNTTKN